jgi:hypothetical protein
MAAHLIKAGGKYLRIVPNLAKGNAGGQQGGQQPRLGPAPLLHGAGAANAGAANHLANVWDSATPFQAWSLRHLDGTLPAVASKRNDDEEDNSSPATPTSPVDRAEVLSLLEGIPSLEARAARSQSVLALRLCGAVLRGDVPDPAARTALAHEVWTRLEVDMSVPMTVSHYNALLAVYLENGHAFCPAHVQSRLRGQRLREDRDTFEAFLARYCADGNMDGANRIMKVS